VSFTGNVEHTIKAKAEHTMTQQELVEYFRKAARAAETPGRR
jgi:hypothetical protein